MSFETHNVWNIILLYSNKRSYALLKITENKMLHVRLLSLFIVIA
jgi:hypothetical protein